MRRSLLSLVLFVVCYVEVTLTVSAQQIAAAAYAPRFTPCPRGTSLVRRAEPFAQSLNPSEAAFIKSRQAHVLPKQWSSYLQNVKHAASSQHAQLPSYVAQILSNGQHAPHLAIATSGGGYRAAIFGAGVMTTLDARNASAAKLGTGGLLQAASYISGLSGGSWLLGSLVQNDFPTFPELIFGSSKTGSEGWIAQLDLTQPSSSQQANLAYIELLLGEVAGKFLSGFPVTIADLWARALSRHFVNGTTAATLLSPNGTHGAGQTLSGLVNLPSFVSHSMPFPIITSDSLTNGSKPIFFTEDGTDDVPLTSPIYEFTPYEMGSYDPMLSAFTPTKFLGSPNSTTCVIGFDQVSFIESSSSELFNELNTSATALAQSSIGPLIGALQQAFNQSANIELDATLVPNPFFGVNKGSFPDANQKFLKLVDGGEDGQVLPLQPLLVKARNVDTIIGIDAPADLDDAFTAGFDLIASQERASLFPEIYSFPPVPKSTTTFINQNLTKRPTFFGCNLPRSAAAKTPLLIYIANGGPPLGQAPLTNTTTGQTAYPAQQIQGMLDQTWDIATQGIPKVGRGGKEEKDPLWPVCLACAVVERQRERSGVPRSGVCKSCLDRYCWS